MTVGDCPRFVYSLRLTIYYLLQIRDAMVRKESIHQMVADAGSIHKNQGNPVSLVLTAKAHLST